LIEYADVAKVLKQWEKLKAMKDLAKQETEKNYLNLVELVVEK
jgi:hypothetical protein